MIIKFDGKEIECSDEFSCKDFTGWRNLELSGNIYGSCFSQEIPDTESITGKANFYHCNLDNVLLPDGCEAFECSQKRFKVQNDLNDWLVDEQDKPLMPIDHKSFTKFGLPIPQAKGIPTEKQAERIDLFAAAVVDEVIP